MEHPKYSAFDISKVIYKTVKKQPIEAYILVPKGLQPGHSPIHVTFHGGFFVTGAALFSDWFQQWYLDYTLEHNAILVSPNYRLAPEANGEDILEDIADFWRWLHSDLGTHLSGRTQPDLTRILATGGSAGGRIALLSWLHQPSNSINAVVASYPSVELVTKPRTKPIMGTQTVPPEVLQNYLANMDRDKIVTEAYPPERMEIGLSIAQQNRAAEIIGEKDEWIPLRYVRKVDKEVLQGKENTYVAILHGEDDSVVPVEFTRTFEEYVNNKWATKMVNIFTQPGEHGFDNEIAIDAPWLRSLLEPVTKAWLQSH